MNEKTYSKKEIEEGLKKIVKKYESLSRDETCDRYFCWRIARVIDGIDVNEMMK